MGESVKKPNFYYGWWIVGAGFLTMFISIGMIGYGVGVFFNAMLRDLGWSRGDLALAMSIGIIFSATILPLVGVWVDKHGAGRLVALSAFACGSILMVASQIHALWQAFVIFSLFKVVLEGFRDVPIATMVSNWFVKKRGRAIGITMAGTGLGGFIMTPISTYLISTIGWRISWVILGLVIWAVVIPPALLIMKHKPEPIGLLPDGEAAETTKVSGGIRTAKKTSYTGDEWSLQNALRTSVFWLIALTYLLFYTGYLGMQLHNFSLLTDKGIPAKSAGMMIGVIGLFAFGSKIVLGYLTDRIPVRYVVMGAMAINIVATSLLLTSSTQILWLYAALFGFSAVGIVGLLPILTGACFKTAIIGRVLGISYSFMALGNLLGPAFMGYTFDISGTYDLALSVFIALFVVTLPLLFFSRPPREMTSPLT